VIPAPLGWFGIVRLGIVQAALGALVVLATSTMNRVMVVELALPASLPGALVALHYGVQVLRPRMGYGSDVGGRRVRWIVGGMALLAAGVVLAAAATAWLARDRLAGIALALLAFTAVGAGVGAAGTSLLALLARRVDAGRRAAAATILWLMMIAGIAVTATIAGKLLDPFTPARLIQVTAAVAAIAFAASALALWGVDRSAGREGATRPAEVQPFLRVLNDIWAEPPARRFAVFVFVAMLAYSAQELILEPFAGAVFGLTPGESTRLNGVQHAGVLAGMLLVAVGASLAGGFRAKAMRAWTVGGCLASAAAILCLAAAGLVGPAWPLRASVLAVGAANGMFAVSAIGAMMGLAGSGRGGRDGIRIGLWGAAQALAFGLGGLLGTSASDLARALFGSPAAAYGAVFLAEAALFLCAARIAMTVFATPAPALPEPAARFAGSPG
jgi:BCD family chlorophyll transporter-like MFS transporter